MSIGVAAAALTSCGGGGHRGATGATVPPAVTTTAIDVAQVPASIDIPYVQKVMDSLDQVLGDAIRVFVANKGPNQQFIDLLSAVYDEPAYTMEVNEFGRLAARLGTGEQPFRPSPGNPQTQIERVVDSSSLCIVVTVDRGFQAVFVAAPPAGSTVGVIQLKAKRAERDRARRNTTPWAIVADGQPSSTLSGHPCH